MEMSLWVKRSPSLAVASLEKLAGSSTALREKLEVDGTLLSDAVEM